MASTKPGTKEVTQVVQVNQPFCIRFWGINDPLRGNCPAWLGIHGPQKCHNTRKTCAVPNSYSAGENYLLFNGSSGQYAWTPDSAALDITGDIDIVVKVALNDWSPAGNQCLMSKYVTSGNNLSWSFNVNATGVLRLDWSTTGAAGGILSHTSSTTVPAADGTIKWVRVVLDVNNGAGREARFYTSDDGYTWTQLGTTQTNGATTSIFAGAAAAEVGANQVGTVDVVSGRIYYAEVRNGIDAPPAAVFDINDADRDAQAQIVSSRTGEMWQVGASGTLNGQTVIGFTYLRFTPGQSGVQKIYPTAVPTMDVKPITSPETLNLSGMDQKSEGLLGQRETVTVGFRNDLSDDHLVDNYRRERFNAVASTKYVQLPGSSGNYISTPDSSANSITGDITIRCLVSMDDWSPATEATILSKWGASGGTFSYLLSVTTARKLKLYWSTDGSNVLSAESTVVVPVSDGQKLWIMAALLVNDGAGGRAIHFATASPADFNPFLGTTHTSLGSSVNQAGTTSIFNSTSVLSVGAHGAGTLGLWSGKVWYADIDAGFAFANTSPVAVMNPQFLPVVEPVISSWVSQETVEVWDINKSGSPTATLVAEAPGYDPGVRGTRWGKFKARNPYSSGYGAVVYDGVLGQTLRQMKKRSYVVRAIDGPDSSPSKVVTLTLRDFFDKITSRKATAPGPNKGELFANMTGSPSTFTLFPSGIGNAEYAASGYVCVDREIIQYTRSNDTMTVVARGALGTTQSDHLDEDQVQQVLVYSGVAIKDIIYSLLVAFGKIPVEWINSLAWIQSMSAITELYSAVIPKPTAVDVLLGEICELVGLALYPNVNTGLIDLVPIRPAVPLATMDDTKWIVKGSMKPPKRLDARRVSRCLVRYGPKDPTVELDQKNNFRSRALYVDQASESPTEYGSASLKEINTRWIPGFGGAVALAHATRIVGMLRDPPLQAEFSVPAPLADSVGLQLASTITLNTWDDENFFGDPSTQTHIVVRTARDPIKDVIDLRTLQMQFGPGIVIDKTIYIADDTENFNFRTAWSQLFGTPQTGDTPKCVLLAGIFVGGGLNGVAFNVGDWPAGVVPDITIDGEILPAGGPGGEGGHVVVGSDPVNDSSGDTGDAGIFGGNGLFTTVPIIVRGSGVIRGGFGGGGGGGGGVAVFAGAVHFSAPGGGGGGARGFPPGAGGAGGTDVWGLGGTQDHDPSDTNAVFPASPGTAGTRFTHGTGGAPVRSGEFNTRQIQGGTGGAGTAGGTAAFDFSGQDSYTRTDFQSGGAAGARGTAIIGFSFITFSSWTGTIDGPTSG